MTSEALRRRLAAILAADATGYSRLMSADAGHTVAALDAARAVFRRHIESHGGRVVDTAGDSVLAVFDSANAAVAAALVVQEELASGGQGIDEGRRLRFRIGLHLGEIIEKPDGSVYGDGVNVAARIQALVAPGAICLSQPVRDQIQGGPRLVELGETDLKNIPGRVRVYRVLTASEGPVSPLAARLRFQTARPAVRRRVLAGAGALAIGGLAWRLFQNEHTPDANAARLFVQAQGLTSYSSSHLENKANNEKAIALLEEATRIDPDYAEAHAKLGLSYVIRLFLFAPEERELQQKAYLSVERAFQLNPNLAEAYEARGRLRWTVYNHFPHEDAIRDFRQALKINPNLDETHHYLALVYMHVGLLEEARNECREAVRINPSNNGAQYRIGEAWFYELNYRDALNIFDTIDPAFNPDLHAYHSSWSLFRLGRRDEALARMEKTQRSFPGDAGGLLASTRAMMRAARGERAEAEAAIQIASQRRGFGHFHHAEYNIACAFAMLKEHERALDWFEKAAHEGFNCYPLFEADPSLASLRNVERFQALLADERRKWQGYKASFAKAPS